MGRNCEEMIQNIRENKQIWTVGCQSPDGRKDWERKKVLQRYL